MTSMDQGAHEAINLEGPPGAIDAGYPDPRVEPINDSIDGSGPLFSMYLDIAVKKDREMTDRWRADAKGIILFTGLFSAALAALLTISIQDLRPNSTDISASYLANIFQLLAASGGSPVSIPSTLSPPSSDFSVPKHAIWVNSLWFLSLVISIACALAATFVQQWAHRYIKVIASEEPYTLHKQARIRAFFAEGLDKSSLRLVVEVVPTFLHLSVFLFFAGLCVFLFNLHPTVFNVVVSFVGICVFTYLCIIVMPILRYDTPYHSPLSSLAWYLWTGLIRIFFLVLTLFSLFGFFNSSLQRIPCFSYTSWRRFYDLQERYGKRLQGGIRKAAEELAQKLSSEIDGRALVWTVRSLDRDDKQEQFFANIPAFCDSKALAAPQDAFKAPNGQEMSEALVAFLHSTLSSNLDPKSKQRRIDIFRNAMDAASLSITWEIYQRVLYKDWTGLLNSVEFGLFLKAAKYNDPDTAFHSNHLIAAVITTVQEHDDRWFELATSQLGKSRAVLEGYLTRGDSVLLANCTDICRRTIDAYSEDPSDRSIRSTTQFGSLKISSNFDAQNTLPGLQHDFCCLWNELIRTAGDSADHRMQAAAICILRHIRNIYIALHQGTDSAPTVFDASTDDFANVLFHLSSYPLCNIPAHGSCAHEATLSPTGETPNAPNPTSPTVTPPTAPIVLSSPVPHLSHSAPDPPHRTSFSDVPDGPQPTTQVAAPACPTPERLEGYQRPATLRDVVARGTTQGITDTDLPATSLMAGSDTLSTPVASTSIPLQVFAPTSSGPVAISEAPGMSPSFPPTTVPGHTPPAESDPFPASPASQFDQTPPTTAISLVSPQANPNAADTDPQHPHQTARSGLDIAVDVSLDATPSPRGVDRSQ